ncbi:hypothetical protein [Zhihengliuella sp.]|uniref:hypothetical protein n=1 Tax=Zhihengliuella sp. TaxID=1954483 RepID=UPI002810A3B9|nr:hypothetical protein [Zhihengliuella sp.]
MHNRSEPIKVIALWLMALMFVLVAAAMAIAVVNARVFGPERVVEDYFAALEAGDPATALGLIGAEVPDGNGLMLTPDAVRSSAEHIADVEVAETSAEDGRATVETTFVASGQKHTVRFGLVQTGTDWLFFDRWALDQDSLPALRIDASDTGDIQVNGIASPVEKGSQTFPVLPPAVVEASFEQKYFHAEPTRRVVTDAASAEEPLKLASEPTQRLIDEVSQQVNAYVDSCVEQHVLMPTGCPLTYDTDARVDADTIEWEVVEYPKVEITAFDGAWVLRPMEMHVRLSLVEQDLATGRRENIELEKAYGFTAQLDVGADSALVTPVASE